MENNEEDPETGVEFERDNAAKKEVLDEAEEGTREQIERMEIEDGEKDQKEEPMEVEHEPNSKLESKSGEKDDEEKVKHAENDEDDAKKAENEDVEMQEDKIERENVIMTNHVQKSSLEKKMHDLESIERHIPELIGMKPAGEEAQMAWRGINMLQASQAQRLAEQLRLILEPKKASALKGKTSKVTCCIY